MGKKSIHYFIVGLVVIALLIAFKVYNDHGEKGLDKLIGYNSSSFTSFEFQFHDHEKWVSDKKEPAEELIEFLSNYQVKKMSDREWDGDVSKEQGFNISVYSEGKIVMVFIYEDRIHLAGKGYYKIVNGPIEMEWLTKYNEEYQK